MKDCLRNPWGIEDLKEFLFYCCPDCDVKEKDEDKFLQHAIKEHSAVNLDNDEFIDDIKEEVDPLVTNQEDHESPSPAKKQCKEIQCYYCGDVMFDIMEVKDHISKNHSLHITAKMYGDLRNFQCPECFRMFKTPESLEIHVCEILPPSWLGPSSKVQKCPQCDQDFDKYGDLLCHYSQDHKSDKELFCNHPNCEKRKFVTKSAVELSVHVRQKHRHKCQFCSKEYYSSSALELHNIRCFKKGQPEVLEYECLYCAVGYQTLEALLLHKSDHNQRLLQYYEPLCTQCDYVAPSRAVLRIHKKKKHPVDCTICKKNYQTPKKLEEHHIQVHVNDRSILCEFCDFRCNLMKDLEMHKRRVHEKVKDHSCDKCGKAFYSKWDVNEHIKRNHSSETNVECDKCSKTFKTKKQLTQHINSVHQLFHICTRCEKTYIGVQKFKEHLAQEHNNFDVKEDLKLCSHCDYRFVKTGELNDHLHLDHDMKNEYFCAKCCEAFVTKTVLTSHLIELHDYNPTMASDKPMSIDKTNISLDKNKPRNFKCEECNVYLSSSRTLSDHNKQIHLKESHIHFCKECNWSTFEATRLKKHYQQQHGEKQFACEECNSKFSTQSRLKRHKQDIHNKTDHQYSCSVCKKAFYSRNQLAKHSMNEHQILVSWKPRQKQS